MLLLACGFQLLHIIANTCIVNLSNFGNSYGHTVVSHCDFDFYLSDDSYVKHLFLCFSKCLSSLFGFKNSLWTWEGREVINLVKKEQFYKDREGAGTMSSVLNHLYFRHIQDISVEMQEESWKRSGVLRESNLQIGCVSRHIGSSKSVKCQKKIKLNKN